jgi:hypothetical protein
VAAIGIFTRYTVASAFATTISQVVLVAFALLSDTPAPVAAVTAFAAGAVPQFLIIRRVARGRLPRQVLTYALITAAGGLASIGTVALVDALIEPAVAGLELRALALNLGYLVGGAPVFLAKFLVFDRILFARPVERV